jgi:hypothetical protein
LTQLQPRVGYKFRLPAMTKVSWVLVGAFGPARERKDEVLLVITLGYR